MQATQATFRLVDVESTSSSDIKFFTAEGIPQGSIAYHSYTPALTSVSPAIGSSVGTLLTVTSVGFDSANADQLNLYHTLTAQNICASVDSVSYGTFSCQTIALEITAADELVITIDGIAYGCANTVSPAQCTLSQEKANSPRLTDISRPSASVIRFTGDDFVTGGSQEISCELNGVTGVEQSIDASTVDCTFAAGVPAEDGASAASLRFRDTLTGVALTADTDG